MQDNLTPEEAEKLKEITNSYRSIHNDLDWIQSQIVELDNFKSIVLARLEETRKTEKEFMNEIKNNHNEYNK